MKIRKRSLPFFRPATKAALWAVAVVALGSPSAGEASAVEIAGRIELVDEKGKLAPGVQKSVVYFVPAAGVEPVAAPDEPFEVVTVRKDFQPQVTVVPKGSTVSFPNQDPILHNVFSVSGENRFDLGLYRGGQAKEKTFESPGVVQIFCNVHHAMAAYILVLETPFHVYPETSGDFVLEGLPPGPGTLTVWHERADPWTLEVDAGSSGPLEVRLEIRRKRVPRHLNKFGKPYSRRGKAY